MDELDRSILRLLAQNARMPVKEIAQRVSLTSPAVSSRIHRLEQEGVIGGYTVVLRHPDEPAQVQALISVQVGSAPERIFWCWPARSRRCCNVTVSQAATTLF